MKVLNKSRKIVSIAGEPLLPGGNTELPNGYESNPAIVDFIARGILVDANTKAADVEVGGLSDLEKTRIADEAIAKYKAEQEALAAAQAEKEAAIKEVKDMKKAELLKKATAMNLDIKDDDTVETIREKILSALSE